MNTFPGSELIRSSGGSDAAAIIDHVAETTPHETKIANVYLYANGVIADLRSYTDPTRQRGIRKAFTTDAFVALAKSDANASSRVFYNQAASQFGLVIDYGTTDAPTREEHRVEFTPAKHPEWLAWADLHGKPVPQMTFADFIEEHLDTITNPSGADLLELIQDIKGHKNVTFQTAQRLRDGQTKVSYVEDVATRAGSGDVTIPNMIEVTTPIFRGEDPVVLEAFLRFIISTDGKLTFTLKFKNSASIASDALDRIAERIQGDVTQPLVAGWHA